MAIRSEEIHLEFSGYIDAPPVSTQQLYAQATSSDSVTINAWRDIWIANAKANKARFGSFGDNSIGQLYHSAKNQPVIVAGSGPSLKHNVAKLKERGQIQLVSCLHNFHIMEDAGAAPDLYVSLDAGPVTIEEVTEGGTRSEEEYWELTKDRTLAAFISTDPKLLEKWRGKILFYRCPIPDPACDREMDELEPFHAYVSCGGNVLGSCLYIAKVYMGGNPIAFVGADFAFGYEVSKVTGNPRFHAWDSKYDNGIGQCLRVVDVFGNRVKTWPSYWSFKCFFDRTVIDVPGIWINCTEGGIFGAYDQGNIRQLMQMKLDDFLHMYQISDRFEGHAKRPTIPDKRVCY